MKQKRQPHDKKINYFGLERKVSTSIIQNFGKLNGLFELKNVKITFASDQNHFWHQNCLKMSPEKLKKYFLINPSRYC